MAVGFQRAFLSNPPRASALAVRIRLPPALAPVPTALPTPMPSPVPQALPCAGG